MDSGDIMGSKGLDDFCHGQDQWRLSRLAAQLEITKELAAHWKSECENLARYLQEARTEIKSLKHVLEIDN